MQKRTLKTLTAILTLSFLLGFPGCAKPVSCEILAERFADALMRGSGEDALSLMPEEILNYMYENEKRNPNELARNLTRHFKRSLAAFTLRHGPVRFYTCRIKCFRDYSEESLARLNARCRQYRFTANAARELTIAITLTLESGAEVSLSFSLEIFRIGANWYLGDRYGI
ncbi:MAG: hypothetical protein HFI93_07295 [Lachnospiraceae bacterium]|nr:hypothetical protein [Lachnospiraceae bacterium]